MQREGGRSLLDRMGGRGGRGGQARDEIQARIDAVTRGGGIPQEMVNAFNNGIAPAPGMMPMMQGMDMGAMMNSMNPMALQEVMMNQMALMAQMANSIGVLNAQQGQLLQQQQQQAQPQQNRRGGGPAGRGRGRGGMWNGNSSHEQQDTTPAGSAPAVTPSTSTSTELNPSAPPFTPTLSTPAPAPAQQPGFTPPSRPQSPTLCKFGVKCTNALCRYSHPSPVSTPESGVVLSNDACENGKNCKDRDCIKAHVSPVAAGAANAAGEHTILREGFL